MTATTPHITAISAATASSSPVAPSRTAWRASYRWVRAALRRALTSSSTRSHARDILTVVGGSVVLVGLSALLLATWVTAVVLFAGILTVGSLGL